VQPDQALVRVEVFWVQGQGAPTSACGLGVQSQQERIQRGVIARGRGDPRQFFQLTARQRHAWAAQPARLRDTCRWVFVLCEDAFSDRMLVHAPQRGNQVFGCHSPPAGVSPLHDAALDLLGELTDI
jgi:hypothetical protein